MESSKSNRRNTAGIVLVILGLVFLAENLDLLHLPFNLISWKTILITIGVVLLALGERNGLVPLIIGGSFLVIDDIMYWNFNFRQLWPLFLVIIGVALLLRQRRAATGNILSTPQFDEVAIFSGIEKKVTSESFQGGKATAICGGADIDLRQANLSSETNVIDIFAMFGGTSFKVPSDWTINISQLTVLFGGFSDERVVDLTKADPKKVLNIRGLILFGGGEIKNG